MNLDEFGLPVQLDLDASDQLQRIGMIGCAYEISGAYIKGVANPFSAIRELLQFTPGVYKRFVKATTIYDTTADQLIPIIAFWIMSGEVIQIKNLFLRMLKRFGFAQNIRKQGESNVKTVPDFMLIRSLPIFIRFGFESDILYCAMYPIITICDILLVLASSIYVLQNRTMNNVDDNNLIITLAVCKVKRPTLLSRLACKIYAKYRAPNEGSVRYNIHPVIGALRWYHRPEWPSYGNPEVAAIWEPIVNKYILS